MPSVNPRTLVGKLNPLCRRTLEAAAGFCLSRTNYSVEVEHWLIKLLEINPSDVSRLLKHYEINASVVNRELLRTLDGLRTGNNRAPELAPDILDLMREAWVLSSLEFNATRIRSGFLFAALLNDRALSMRLRSSSPELARIAAEKLIKELRPIITGSPEDEGEAAEAGPSGPSAAGGGGQGALQQFTMDLTERAAKKALDPVIGRDFEIRQMVDILMRRRQNNPILTGEAGVGKTAVVEGFAQLVVAGDVPPPLRNVMVRTLDLGLLQAGAGVKGEFEARLKSVLSEVKASPRPIILFIDEAHTLIGAGGSAGQGDAANLLKPALARGELRTIAATTWDEYKKYFETDPALKRRFQVVKVEEPSEIKAIAMMRGLSSTLENHHKVRVLDEALEDAVKLSSRYITDRQLPDKSVSLIDTACARVALSQSASPAALVDCRRDIELLTVEIDILKRENAAGADHAQRLQERTASRGQAQTRLGELEKRLTEERRLVGELQKLREALEKPMEPGVGQTPSSPTPEDAARQGAEMKRLSAELRLLQGEHPLIHPVVDRQAVAAVVEGWTGVPVGQMVVDEIKTVMQLRARMEERVIGQTAALEVIARRIQTARANLVDPRRPIGVFLLVGPSGVGKTETAVTLADILYGGDRNMVVINMSEYKESHKISRLTGSAKGYVGYGEGGVLTEAVRRRPYSVVLLDEIEKADLAVQELFYQVFDKGMLQDDRENDIDFKNTIILLTSNAASDVIMKLCEDPDTCPEADQLAEALRPHLLKVFKPAFLGRLTVVPYFPLGDEVLRKIIHLQLNRITERLRHNHKAAFVYDEAVVQTIAGRCKEVESGARNIDAILTGSLLPEIAQQLLARMMDGQAVREVRLGVETTGKFRLEFV
jgi:type VI secretion system protein VasG